ncbi:MAG: Pyrophosphate--fructose 6-phosphate 1-phosphotransferase [Firmicutes bacterium ADurb.BinA205]|nr:MAG: Pyrophosphate--fructose 6-phosphate 1-phosphotransferase [Firmicutes bacterium ADurb.BinA205]
MMNIAVAQSGGPTCAINASLVGVFKESLKVSTIDAIFGSVNGIEGIIENHLVDLKSMILTNNDMELLKQTPSTVLGSCRYKLPDWHDDEEVYEKITDTLKQRNIGAFLYIGGNDSMDTVNKLSEYFAETGVDIKVIGIPKTIDNDLCITDHTPGFGSAAKYVATTMHEITRDSIVYSIPSVTIVEIMGRHAGWLTASSAVLHAMGETAPHLVYVPEVKFSLDSFLADVRQEMSKHKAVIVAVSEGIEVPEGVQSGVVDNFGHKYLSGIGKYLEDVVRSEIGCKVRSIELNVMQRCSSHLGSKTDIDEAEAIGAAGVRCALEGETGKVMVFRRIEDIPYTAVIETADAKDIANNEKFLPKKYINSAGNNIRDFALKYFLPLIQGDLNLITENGIPKHFAIHESVLK